MGLFLPSRERRFVLHGDTVEEIGGESQKPTWSIKAPGGLNLRWLAATDAQAFFQAFKPEKEGASAEPETPLRVQRLDIAARKWAPPLELLAAKPQPNRHDTILAVLAKGKLVVVLTESWIESERSFDSPKSMTYRVSYFRDGQEKPAWSKEFASGGTRPAPGVGLWATRMPDYASSDIQHLQWLGDDILVFAGEKDDILCLSAVGKTKWKIERIWEFERGFTGPSVWSHHIGPFRRSSWELPRDDAGKSDDKKTPDERKQADEVRKSLAKEREEFNRQFECAIVGWAGGRTGRQQERRAPPAACLWLWPRDRVPVTGAICPTASCTSFRPAAASRGWSTCRGWSMATSSGLSPMELFGPANRTHWRDWRSTHLPRSSFSVAPAVRI